MKWYYAENGRQAGPVSEEEVCRLVAQKLGPETLVWSAGMAQWQPWNQLTWSAEAQEAAASPDAAVPAVAAEKIACRECGRLFAPEDLITFEGAKICAACKPGFFQKLREGVAIAGPLAYAGFWPRFAAKLIDTLLLFIVNLIVSMPISFMTAGHQPSLRMAMLQILNTLIGIAFGAAYATIFLGRYGATPGKMALGLKVIRADGSSLTYGRAFGRHFGEMVSGLTLCIGYIMAAFDEEKRALHDRICDTRVVRTRTA